MFALLKADLYKLLKNKNTFLVPGILLFLVYGVVFGFMRHNMDLNTWLMLVEIITVLSPLVIGMYLLAITYGSDLKSHNAQAVLGHGYTRIQYLLYKFLFFLMVSIISYLALFVILYLIPVILGIEVSTASLNYVIAQIVVVFLRNLVYLSLSLIFLFMVQSVGASYAIYGILSTQVFASLITMLFRWNKVVNVIGDLSAYLPSNASSELMYNWSKGMTFDSNVLILLAYVVGSLIVSYVVYRNKELEF